MAKIENKKFSFKVEPKHTYCYFELLLEAMNVPPVEGFPLDGMEKRLEIKEMLENSIDKEFIELPTDDFILLRDKALSIKFKLEDKALVDYKNYLKSI